MGEKRDKQETEKPASTLLGTLLGTTDPAILKRMEEERIETAHFAAMGRVATKWALLEVVVDGCSIKLAEISGIRGLCLTSQIFGIKRKLDAFISLA